MLQMNIYKMKTLKFLPLIALLFAACASPQAEEESTKNEATESSNLESTNPEQEESMTDKSKPPVHIVIETSVGVLTAELYPDKAPVTVENFLAYVDDRYYDETIFHRVIDGFMVQGGGFTADGTQKDTKDPIVLESQNGLKNEIGTLAMARTNAPNSATSQFFINVNNNDFLNYRPGNPGYAVFGKVTTGMDILNKIRQVKTGNFQGHADWPVETVKIEKIYREK
jgi:cyclophilin family peptidyl-prolyl cis-trans isomerase